MVELELAASSSLREMCCSPSLVYKTRMMYLLQRLFISGDYFQQYWLLALALGLERSIK